MAEVGTLRLDIAKLVFQVLGVDVAGPVVIRTVARWWNTFAFCSSGPAGSKA